MIHQKWYITKCKLRCWHHGGQLNCQESSTKCWARTEVVLRHLRPFKAKCDIIKCNLSDRDQGGRFVWLSRTIQRNSSKIREGFFSLFGAFKSIIGYYKLQPQCQRSRWSFGMNVECSTKFVARSGKVFFASFGAFQSKICYYKMQPQCLRSRWSFCMYVKNVPQKFEQDQRRSWWWVVDMSPPKEATSAPQTRMTRSSDTKHLPICFVARSIGSKSVIMSPEIGRGELWGLF